MILKSSIRTLALPRRQRSDWGMRVTQNVYFSLMTHTKQLLLVTFYDTIARIGVFFGHTEPEQEPEPWNRMDRQTWKSK